MKWKDGILEGERSFDWQGCRIEIESEVEMGEPRVLVLRSVLVPPFVAHVQQPFFQPFCHEGGEHAKNLVHVVETPLDLHRFEDEDNVVVVVGKWEERQVV